MTQEYLRKRSWVSAGLLEHFSELLHNAWKENKTKKNKQRETAKLF